MTSEHRGLLSLPGKRQVLSQVLTSYSAVSGSPGIHPSPSNLPPPSPTPQRAQQIRVRIQEGEAIGLLLSRSLGLSKFFCLINISGPDRSRTVISFLHLLTFLSPLHLSLQGFVALQGQTPPGYERFKHPGGPVSAAGS